MAKPANKNKGRQSLVQLSRRALAGWVVVVFIISAWMFALGVMVGRGTAPVSFDTERLKRTLESLQGSQQAARSGPRPGPTEMKNKTDLGFYEALPKKREDTDLPNISRPPSAARAEPAAPKMPEASGPAKVEKPAAAAPAPPLPASAAPGKPFTVQVSAVKSEEEARRLLEKLRQRGYAGYIEPVAIPEKGTWYRVRMGEFPSRDLARSTMDRLKKDGFSPVVVPK